MPRTKHVTMKKDDLQGQVMPQAVKAWERHGWTVVDDGSSEPAPAAPAPQDPSGRTQTKE